MDRICSYNCFACMYKDCILDYIPAQQERELAILDQELNGTKPVRRQKGLSISNNKRKELVDAIGEKCRSMCEGLPSRQYAQRFKRLYAIEIHKMEAEERRLRQCQRIRSSNK